MRPRMSNGKEEEQHLIHCFCLNKSPLHLGECPERGRQEEEEGACSCLDKSLFLSRGNTLLLLSTHRALPLPPGTRSLPCPAVLKIVKPLSAEWFVSTGTTATV